MAVGDRTATGQRESAVEIRHLSALLALASDPHFGRAAQRLHVAQSTLSRTIADLEALVGATLVHRTRRTVGLTDAGRALLAGAQEAVGAVDRAVSEARTAARRTPVIGIQSPIGHRWLARVGSHGFRVRRVSPAEGFDPLRGGVDAMISPLPIVPPRGLHFAVLGATRPHVAVPAWHPAARGAPTHLQALGGEPVVLPPLHDVWYEDLDLLFRAQGVELLRAPAAASMHEALARVADGEGWSFAPAREYFHSWEGVALVPLESVASARVALVWDPAGDRHAAPLAVALAEVAQRSRSACLTTRA